MADIEDAIASLGGRVAPKLSWSSPHDAAWVSARSSLACCSASEVLHIVCRQYVTLSCSAARVQIPLSLAAPGLCCAHMVACTHACKLVGRALSFAKRLEGWQCRRWTM